MMQLPGSEQLCRHLVDGEIDFVPFLSVAKDLF